ncbi:MAG TPA: hypothetical protein VFA33_12975 [Bryobacteraceae bacterium]|nr:hypothetical protein [Bryobacteraceae bacterium]
MAVVLAALEAYWEGRGLGQQAQERLLYNLWKECGKWLKHKEQKPNQGSELFQRRKNNVENLQSATMEELFQISPNVRQALGWYEERKRQGPLGFGLKPLSPGYERERQYYELQGKQSGSSISESRIGIHVDFQWDDPRMRKFVGKTRQQLTMDEALKLAKLFNDPPVVFRNKIERLRNLAMVGDDGLFYDIDGNPILMNALRLGKYRKYVYAMDKYGNVFTDDLGIKQYVKYNPQTGRHTLEQTDTFNHSSLLAGGEVLCAGCIHIGYDAHRQREKAGWLSAIDNNSGHYKAGSEHLRNAVVALRDQGVDIAWVRVLDASGGRDNLVCYWGDDVIDGFRDPWPDLDSPPPLGIPAPPVES